MQRTHHAVTRDEIGTPFDVLRQRVTEMHSDLMRAAWKLVIVGTIAFAGAISFFLTNTH